MGSTSNYSWPYPESSDFVADGATAIEDLADAVDQTLGGTTFNVNTSTGRIGIGTASPDNFVHVKASGTSAAPASVPATHMIIADAAGANDAGIAVYSSTTGNGYLRFGDTDGSAIGGFSYDHSTNELKVRTNGTDQLTIANDGLTVNGDIQITGATPELFLTDTDTGADSRISASSSVGSLIIAADINNEVAGTNIVFQSDGQDRMYIKDSGRVGIGMNDPECELELAGQMLIGRTGGPHLRVRDTDTGSDNISAYFAFEKNNGTRIGYMGYPSADDMYFKNETGGGRIIFATNNTNRAFFDATTGALLPMNNNTYDLGSNSLKWRYIYVQEGVRFNDTSGTKASIAQEGTANVAIFSDDLVSFWESDSVGKKWYSSLNNNGASYNTAGTWGTYSDPRLKNFLETSNYFDRLLQLQVRKYELAFDQIQERTEDGDIIPMTFVERTEKPEMLGFNAEEVEQIFPGLVEEDDWGLKTIKSSVLTPMLVQAIQTIDTRLNALEQP